MSKNQQTDLSISSKIIIIIALSCFIIAAGIGLVFWGVYILNTWDLVETAWFVLFFWAGIFWVILAFVFIGAGIVGPIGISDVSAHKSSRFPGTRCTKRWIV